MPKASKASASNVSELPGYEGRFEQLGDHTVGFERFEEAVDAAPLFQGLPDDRCQSPHWGIVVAGSITFRYADHEETIEAGEAYYAAPGHTPVLAAGTEVIEFSPTAQLQATMEVVGRNAAATLGSR
jgi:hypothetical protein